MWPVVVCTEPFRMLGESNAKALGVPGLDILLIPHPLGVRSVEEVEALGREVAHRIVALAERVAV